jgi:predicted transposase/invertase (TIGR01784 family)
MKKGIEKGIEKGREEGAHEQAIETANNLLQIGLAQEQIAQATGLGLETIRALQSHQDGNET